MAKRRSGLGNPINASATYFSFVNQADMDFEHTITLIGRDSGQVDMILPVGVARMTTEDAERLIRTLDTMVTEIKVAKASRDAMLADD